MRREAIGGQGIREQAGGSELQEGAGNKIEIERRDFLRAVGAGSTGLAAARAAKPAGAASDLAAEMPRVPFGPYKVSRLVCGSNCFAGGSHLSGFVNREMRAYYTTEQKLRTLRRCEEVGVTLWQGHADLFELYRQLRNSGSRIRYISLGAGGDDGYVHLEKLIAAGAIGVAHHGEVTDRLFKSGKIDEIHDFLKRVRDKGLQVGVSTHMPAVVDYVESKGWDVDFYMTCVYERHRSAEDLKRLLGHVPIPVGEVYLQSDPPRMFEAIRRTKRTCLAFKILAAGRLSDRGKLVDEAFRETFRSIKPIDAVIVGIYDRYTDQPAQNAAMTRKYSPLSGQT